MPKNEPQNLPFPVYGGSNPTQENDYVVIRKQDLFEMCRQIEHTQDLIQKALGSNPFNPQSNAMPHFIDYSPPPTAPTSTAEAAAHPFIDGKKRQLVFTSEEVPAAPKKKRREKAKPIPNSESEKMYCRSCGETKTQEWRRGPDGYKSLCNACGLKFAKVLKKEEAVAAEYQPKRVALTMLVDEQDAHSKVPESN